MLWGVDGVLYLPTLSRHRQALRCGVRGRACGRRRGDDIRSTSLDTMALGKIGGSIEICISDC